MSETPQEERREWEAAGREQADPQVADSPASHRGLLTPLALTLGPYTIGRAEGFTPGVDLGIVLGIVREYAIVVTAFDGDEPEETAQVNIDFDVSLDGEEWRWTSESPADRPQQIGEQPAGFKLSYLPGTVRGNIIVPRFIRFHHEAERVGAGASATFHVNLSYF